MLKFLESGVLGMWNDAVFPSLSSPLNTSFGNSTDPWLLSSNSSSSELEKLSNCGHFFSTFQGSYSDCLQLQIFPPPDLEPNAGFITGNGDPMIAKVSAESVACSDDRAQPKVAVERRKRSIERDKTNTSHQSKRLKSTVHSQKQHHLPQGESSMAGTSLVKAPVRKSQKLGDKITALQQLVSPFGKTDTASVLHEAALSIKFLHEQMRMLTAPYFGMRSSQGHVQGHEENSEDLQSRSLCLVPLSTILGLMDQKAYDSCWETDLNFQLHHHGLPL